jgi:hypothetical protein
VKCSDFSNSLKKLKLCSYQFTYKVSNTALWVSDSQFTTDQSETLILVENNLRLRNFSKLIDIFRK